MVGFPIKSQVPGFVWPAVPDAVASHLMAWLYQLEQSQWQASPRLEQLQFDQLVWLVGHAFAYTPYYRPILQNLGFEQSAHWLSQNWQRIPLLTRENLVAEFASLRSTGDLRLHGELFEKSTSGSTGTQIRVMDTDANNLLWLATTMRDHHWHARDFSGHFVTIRSGRYESNPCAIEQSSNWGIPASYMYDTGPATNFFHLMPIPQQAALLIQLRPNYLMAYPSNVLRLTRYFEDNRLSLPSLRGVITYGELLLPEVCLDVARIWNTNVVDVFSCEEVGYIALQCPHYNVYHCQSESVKVEVLLDDGTACQPGESGRVVLTSLHNFAMPIIRYETRDYAEVSADCPCGRGGLTLKRMLGRERNRVLLLDGRKRWANITSDVWMQAVADIEELQLEQVSPNHIRATLVRHHSLNHQEQSRLVTALDERLGGNFEYTFLNVQEVRRHPNGKYERFIRRTA